MEDLESQPLDLLSLPPSVRTLLYEAIFPSGFTINLNHERTTSIGPYVSLHRTCRQLHQELTNYLSTKPITLLCTAGGRPNVLHKIPRSVMQKVEVVVIEDNPSQPLVIGLLPSLRCICFMETWHSTYDITQASNPLLPPRSRLLPLPTNNDALKTAHQSWKNLRIDNIWVRNIWKDRPDIRFILRRVNEVSVSVPADIQHGHDTMYSYHSVVDVSTESIIEKRYLPTRPETTLSDADLVFEYGARNWWKLENGWRRSDRIED